MMSKCCASISLRRNRIYAVSNLGPTDEKIIQIGLVNFAVHSDRHKVLPFVNRSYRGGLAVGHLQLGIWHKKAAEA